MMPTVLFDPKKKADTDFWDFYKKWFWTHEGFPTTLTALAVDGELTFGTGFATSGFGPQSITKFIFDKDPALKKTAFELGVDSDGHDFLVADTTTTDGKGNAQPCLLKGTDAFRYISCDLKLMSFFANLGIGAQPDLSGATAVAPDAARQDVQRQLMIDAQWTEGKNHALKSVPGGFTDEALFLVLHSRHAGHGFDGWDGRGASDSPSSVAAAIWAKLKAAGESLASRSDVATRICQGTNGQGTIDALIKKDTAAGDK